MNLKHHSKRQELYLCISTLGKLRQEDCFEFEVTLGFLVYSYSLGYNMGPTHQLKKNK